MCEAVLESGRQQHTHSHTHTHTGVFGHNPEHEPFDSYAAWLPKQDTVEGDDMYAKWLLIREQERERERKEGREVLMLPGTLVQFGSGGAPEEVIGKGKGEGQYVFSSGLKKTCFPLEKGRGWHVVHELGRIDQRAVVKKMKCTDLKQYLLACDPRRTPSEVKAMKKRAVLEAGTEYFAHCTIIRPHYFSLCLHFLF